MFPDCFTLTDVSDKSLYRIDIKHLKIASCFVPCSRDDGMWGYEGCERFSIFLKKILWASKSIVTLWRIKSKKYGNDNFATGNT
jgi:hypothetical protein